MTIKETISLWHSGSRNFPQEHPLPSKVQHNCKCYADKICLDIFQGGWVHWQCARRWIRGNTIWLNVSELTGLRKYIGIFWTSDFQYATVFGLWCGYEWDLFTLSVAMWLTLPHPFSRAFPWQQLSMEQYVCTHGWSWNGALGIVRLSRDHACFFWLQQQTQEPPCNERERESERAGEREREREREKRGRGLLWINLV